MAASRGKWILARRITRAHAMNVDTAIARLKPVPLTDTATVSSDASLNEAAPISAPDTSVIATSTDCAGAAAGLTPGVASCAAALKTLAAPPPAMIMARNAGSENGYVRRVIVSLRYDESNATDPTSTPHAPGVPEQIRLWAVV